MVDDTNREEVKYINQDPFGLFPTKAVITQNSAGVQEAPAHFAFASWESRVGWGDVKSASHKWRISGGSEHDGEYEGQNLGFVFETPGTYRVELEVTDLEGYSDKVSTNIIVKETNFVTIEEGTRVSSGGRYRLPIKDRLDLSKLTNRDEILEDVTIYVEGIKEDKKPFVIGEGNKEILNILNDKNTDIKWVFKNIDFINVNAETAFKIKAKDGRQLNTIFIDCDITTVDVGKSIYIDGDNFAFQNSHIVTRGDLAFEGNGNWLSFHHSSFVKHVGGENFPCQLLYFSKNVAIRDVYYSNSNVETSPVKFNYRNNLYNTTIGECEFECGAYIVSQASHQEIGLADENTIAHISLVNNKFLTDFSHNFDRRLRQFKNYYNLTNENNIFLFDEESFSLKPLNIDSSKKLITEATEVEHTIGTGGNYATVDDWITATANPIADDCVYIGKLLDGEHTLAASTYLQGNSDSTRYRILTYANQPYNPITDTGPKMMQPWLGSGRFSIGANEQVIGVGLQIAANGVNRQGFYFASSGGNPLLDGCTVIATGEFGTTLDDNLALIYASLSGTVRNCVIIDKTTNGGHNALVWGRSNVYNCSVYNSSKCGVRKNFTPTGEGGVIANVVSVDSATTDFTFVGTDHTASYLVSSDATAIGTGSQTNKTASECYNSAGTDDLRPKANGALDGTGTNLSAFFSNDVLFSPRTEWSIGAFDLAAGAESGSINITGTINSLAPTLVGAATSTNTEVNIQAVINKNFTTTEYVPAHFSFDAWDSTISSGSIHECKFSWTVSGGSEHDGIYTGANLGLIFETVGTFTVKLDLEDTSGNTSSATTTVTVASPTYSNTIYVSTSTGNDANAGTEALPKQTLAAAWNAMLASHSNGEHSRVLLNRGETYTLNGALTTPTSSSGTFYLDAYGSGGRPIVNLTGSCVVLDYTNTASQQNGYRILNTIFVNVDEASGATQFTMRVNDNDDVPRGLDFIMAHCSYTLDAQVGGQFIYPLTAWSGGYATYNPDLSDPKYPSYTSHGRMALYDVTVNTMATYVMYGFPSKWFTILSCDLNLNRPAGVGGGHCVRLPHSKHTSIRNSTLGSQARDRSILRIQGLTVDGPNYDTNLVSSRITIEGCQFNCGMYGGIGASYVENTFGDDLVQPAGLIQILNNKFVEHPISGPSDLQWHAIGAVGDKIAICGNILYAPTGPGGQLLNIRDHDTSETIANANNEILVANNTVVSSSNVNIIDLSVATFPVKLTIKNNAVDAPSAPFIRGDGTSSSTNLVCDNNVCNVSAWAQDVDAGSSESLTLSQFRSTYNLDNNSYNSLPEFSDPAGDDFSIPGTSDCYENGVEVKAAWLTIYGTERSIPFDIGAVESSQLQAIIGKNSDSTEYAPAHFAFHAWDSIVPSGNIHECKIKWTVSGGSEHDGVYEGHNLGFGWLTPGTFTVRLDIEDTSGNSAFTTTTVTVASPSYDNVIYVASNGNDSNPGTEAQPKLTITSAWSTLKSAHNNGDHSALYLRAGDTFTHSGTDSSATLETPSSGSGTFYFLSYGSGNKPVVSRTGTSGNLIQNQTSTSRNFKLKFLNVEMRNATSSSVASLYEDDADLVPGAMGFTAVNTKFITTGGTCFNVREVWLSGLRDITYPEEPGFSNIGNLCFQDCEIVGWQRPESGSYYTFYGQAKWVTITGGSVYQADFGTGVEYQHLIRWQWAQFHQYRDCFMQCRSSYGGVVRWQTGSQIPSTQPFTVSNRNTIVGCTFEQSSYAVLALAYVDNDAFGIDDVVFNRYISVLNNHIYESPTHPPVLPNWLGIGVGGDAVAVVGNTLYAPTTRPFFVFVSETKAEPNGTGANNRLLIANNSFYCGTSLSPVFALGYDNENWGLSYTTAKVINNAAKGGSAFLYAETAEIGALVAANLISNNNVYDGSVWAEDIGQAGDQTLTQWKSSTGKDLNSYSTNPGFIDPENNDWSVSESSDTRGNGIEVKAAWLTQDNNERQAPWDIGAVDFDFQNSIVNAVIRQNFTSVEYAPAHFSFHAWESTSTNNYVHELKFKWTLSGGSEFDGIYDGPNVAFVFNDAGVYTLDLEVVDDLGVVGRDSVTFSVANPTFNQTIYVSGNGNDTTGDGTVGSPYRTVNKAWTELLAAHQTGWNSRLLFERGFSYSQTISVTPDSKNGSGTFYIQDYGSGNLPELVVNANVIGFITNNDNNHQYGFKLTNIKWRQTQQNYLFRTMVNDGSTAVRGFDLAAYGCYFQSDVGGMVYGPNLVFGSGVRDVTTYPDSPSWTIAGNAGFTNCTFRQSGFGYTIYGGGKWMTWFRCNVFSDDRGDDQMYEHLMRFPFAQFHTVRECYLRCMDSTTTQGRGTIRYQTNGQIVLPWTISNRNTVANNEIKVLNYGAITTSFADNVLDPVEGVELPKYMAIINNYFYEDPDLPAPLPNWLAIVGGGDFMVIAGNTLYAPNYKPAMFAMYESAANHNEGDEKMLICNNSSYIAENLTGAHHYSFASETHEFQNIKLRNNLAYGGDRFMACSIGPNPEIYSRLDSDYNVFRGTTGQEWTRNIPISGSQTLAEWQAYSGQDLHSFNVDPKLVDPLNNNWNVESDSVCIDAGIYLPAAWRDQNGVERLNPPDIGAVEVLTDDARISGSIVAPFANFVGGGVSTYDEAVSNRIANGLITGLTPTLEGSAQTNTLDFSVSILQNLTSTEYIPAHFSFDGWVLNPPEGGPHECKYKWTVSGGSEHDGIYTGPNLGLVFETVGTFDIRLDVEDTSGRQSFATTSVTVASPTFDNVLYVDTTLGLDTNPGTEAQPFRTLQAAWDELRSIHTAGEFSKISLKRGETFAVSGYIGEPSASSGHYYFDAYGSGNKPIINCTTGIFLSYRNSSSKQSTFKFNNIKWITSGSGANVFLGGVNDSTTTPRGTDITFANCESTSSSMFFYFLDEYVGGNPSYTPDLSDPDYPSFSYQGNCAFYKCNFVQASGYILYGFLGKWGTVLDSTILKVEPVTGGHTMRFPNAKHFSCRNSIIGTEEDGRVVLRFQGASARGDYSSGTRPVSNRNTVANCEVRCGGYLALQVDYADDLTGEGPTRTPGRIAILNNKFVDHPEDPYPAGTWVAIEGYCDALVVAGNTLYSNQEGRFFSTYNTGGDTLVESSKEVLIANNTIVSPATIAQIEAPSTLLPYKLTLKNNVLDIPNGRFIGGNNNIGSGEIVESNYNITNAAIWLYDVYSSQSLNLSQTQSTYGFDLNSFSTDPLITDAANDDFSLSNDSDGVGTGIFLPSSWLDILGIERTYPYSMGAVHNAVEEVTLNATGSISAFMPTLSGAAISEDISTPPTTEYHTIGTGGDFEDIAAWLIATSNPIADNKIYVGQLLSQVHDRDGKGPISLSGNSDATRYRILTYADQPYDPVTNTGPIIYWVFRASTCLYVGQYEKVVGIGFEVNANSSRGSVVDLNSNSGGVVERCCVIATGEGQVVGTSYLNCAYRVKAGGKAINCIAIDKTTTGSLIGFSIETNGFIYNCLAYSCKTYGVYSRDGDGGCINTISVNSSTEDYGNLDGGNIDTFFNCISSDTTADGPISFINQSESDLFINASLDNFNLIGSSVAVTNGENISQIFTTDFDGNTRTVWSIGPYEGATEERTINGSIIGLSPTISGNAIVTYFESLRGNINSLLATVEGGATTVEGFYVEGGGSITGLLPQVTGVSDEVRFLIAYGTATAPLPEMNGVLQSFTGELFTPDLITGNAINNSVVQLFFSAGGETPSNWLIFSGTTPMASSLVTSSIPGSASSAYVSGFDENDLVFFRIKSYRASNDEVSNYSDEIYIVTTPRPATQIRFIKVPGVGYILRWTDNSDVEVSYNIYKDGFLLSSLPPNSEEILDEY